jgi:uncharacterized HAD superfamily protein
MNYKEKLYLAIMILMDLNDMTIYDISNVLQVSTERLKELMDEYE